MFQGSRYFEARDGYDIYQGGEPDVDVLRDAVDVWLICAKECLVGWDWVKREYGLAGVEDEERLLSEVDSFAMSGHFAPGRDVVRVPLSAVIGSVFDQYELPRANLLDVGCGINSAMIEDFLPLDVDRDSCVGIDVHPEAIAAGKRFHRDVRKASYLNLQRDLGLSGENFDIVTGLSAYDSTFNLRRAVENAAFALRPGGWLLHVQDVLPSLEVGLKYMHDLGQEPPYHMPAYRPSCNTNHFQPIAFKVDKEGCHVPLIELFRRQLRAAIEGTQGLEVVLDDWVSAESDSAPFDRGMKYAGGVFLIDTAYTRDRISALVTLARKV